MSGRHLRKPADFLRVRKGVTERKCLDCGKWLVEADHYNANMAHGRRGYDARCRPCHHAHRAAIGKASDTWRNGVPAPAVKMPKEPPPLEWPTVLRGVL